jgi:uncharacterized membrane protein
MRPSRKIPAIIATALIISSLLIIYVHLAWPERFDRLVEPFLPWRVEIGVKLAAAVLTIGVVLLLVASTGGSREQK